MDVFTPCGEIVNGRFYYFFTVSMALCSSNSICCAPVIWARGRGDYFGMVALRYILYSCMMHWTSTTSASSTPVTIASSCCRKLPAMVRHGA
jgi:hypothetical protein